MIANQSLTRFWGVWDAFGAKIRQWKVWPQSDLNGVSDPHLRTYITGVSDPAHTLDFATGGGLARMGLSSLCRSRRSRSKAKR
jgi:hypothetical protein